MGQSGPGPGSDPNGSHPSRAPSPPAGNQPLEGEEGVCIPIHAPGIKKALAQSARDSALEMLAHDRANPEDPTQRIVAIFYPRQDGFDYTIAVTDVNGFFVFAVGHRVPTVQIGGCILKYSNGLPCLSLGKPLA